VQSRNIAEVAQLYLSFPDKQAYPFKQLRGFEKVELAPAARKLLTFTLRWDDEIDRQPLFPVPGHLPEYLTFDWIDLS
jgi:hypothetical protein